MKPDDQRTPSVSVIRLHGGPFEGRTLQSSWFPKTFGVDGATYEFRGFEARYEYIDVTTPKADEAAEGLRRDAKADLQRWAARYEALAPAARDGYDVSSEVLQAIEADVVAKLRGAGFVVPDETVSDDGERRAPRPGALEKRDQAMALLRNDGELMPACVTIDVGRIVRLVFTADDEALSSKKATGFIVVLKCDPLGLRRQVPVLAEDDPSVDAKSA